MRTEKEVRDEMENIKLQLTRVDTEMGRVAFQSQFAALDWVISLDEKVESEVK